jgi:hypothetical protein
MCTKTTKINVNMGFWTLCPLSYDPLYFGSSRITKYKKSVCLLISDSSVTDDYFDNNKNYEKCSKCCSCPSTQHAARLIKECCARTRSRTPGVLRIESHPSSSFCYISDTSLTAVAYTIHLRVPHK